MQMILIFDVVIILMQDKLFLYVLTFRLYCMPSRWMQPVARWNGVLSQYVCVWSQVKTISPPKIAEPIELLFGGADMHPKRK